MPSLTGLRLQLGLVRPEPPLAAGGSAVGLAAMGYLQHQHNQFTVLDVTNQPAVAHPKRPGQAL